jgi:hypothetical protein
MLLPGVVGLPGRREVVLHQAMVWVDRMATATVRPPDLVGVLLPTPTLFGEVHLLILLGARIVPDAKSA